ncbi:hypothetical protein M9H77_25953 [Catharanthus roseus]|uniref:Uncharacterized protein n=1 Tax=Catharanthus roseus TaxID=4058 RepID=A0ACC0A8E1_CATRO|nr:hypothetical protein M9H77_25953 [Catharanthus roseus]
MVRPGAHRSDDDLGVVTDRTGRVEGRAVTASSRGAWIYMYFPMFAPPVRLRARLCKPHIQRFVMLGHKTEKKLVDLRIHLDTMTADEIRWIPYRSDEIIDV